jgi:hypothetical protein
MNAGDIFNVNEIPEYNNLEISDAGKIILGEVHGSCIHISYVIEKEGIEGVNLAIYRSDKSVNLINIFENKNIGITINKIIPFDAEYNIIGVAAIVCIDGRIVALNHDKNKSFLDRLFADNIDKVNEYIRWGHPVIGPRIADLDTRFFAALNSINQVPSDFIHHSRCLVSFSYRAIEDGDDKKIEWALGFCRSHLKEFASCKSTEVRSSFLCAWLHLAIYYTDIKEIYIINDYLYNTSKVISKKEGGAVYNIFQSKILIGGIFLSASDKAGAQEIFEDFDILFRIAVDSFPRNWINNFRELDIISKKMLVCATALDICKDIKIYLEYKIPEFSAEYAWEQGNRLHSATAQHLNRDKYFRLIDLHVENLKSTDNAE